MLTEVIGLRVIDEENPMRNLVFGNLICFVICGEQNTTMIINTVDSKEQGKGAGAGRSLSHAPSPFARPHT